MYISSDVADRIRETAKANGLIVKQVLDQAGLNKNMMTMMRSSMPKADNLAKIADYLGCSVDYLLGRTEAASPSLSEEEQELLSAFHKLDEKDRYKALGYIDSLYSADKYSAKDECKNA